MMTMMQYSIRVINRKKIQKFSKDYLKAFLITLESKTIHHIHHLCFICWCHFHFNIIQFDDVCCRYGNNSIYFHFKMNKVLLHLITDSFFLRRPINMIVDGSRNNILRFFTRLFFSFLWKGNLNFLW